MADPRLAEMIDRQELAVRSQADAVWRLQRDRRHGADGAEAREEARRRRRRPPRRSRAVERTRTPRRARAGGRSAGRAARCAAAGGERAGLARPPARGTRRSVLAISRSPRRGWRALVDWRRSARGDRYYVREREREAAQTAWFWIDPDRGLQLDERPRRGRPSCTARARSRWRWRSLLQRGGERVGALGQSPRAGARAVDRWRIDLLAPMRDAQAPPRSCVIFLSDFYAPVETWRARLHAAAAAGATRRAGDDRRSGGGRLSVPRPHAVSASPAAGAKR